MAALDRRNPNLDDFVGLNWSCWVERLNISLSDGVSDADDSKYGRSRSEAMTLRQEDMHIFGHCPAHDEICLVVCSHCEQVVKPQAFEKHCERRHGALTKMCGQSSSVAPQQRPRPGRPAPNLSSPRERQKDGRCFEASGPSAAPTGGVHQHRPPKAQREAVRLPSVEKFPQENASLPQQSSSTPRPRAPPWHSGPLPPGHGAAPTPPPERPPAQKPSAGRSSESHNPLWGARTYSRIYKNIDKKECDLNKHHRVVDPERKKLCSRELICNTDSLHQQQQQQKVTGRTKTFDPLAASAGRDVEQPHVKSKDKEQLLESFEEKAATTTQGNKYNLSNKCHILRSRDPVESFAEEAGDSTVDVDVQPPYPFNQRLLSSEDSEEDEQEEAAELPATPWHPKPLGLCTFGCRTLGCSIFTFDRRWHHLRFALSAMLEHHVSAHLWKKMPQVSSGLRSFHAASPPVGSTGRTGTRTSKPSGSLSLESTSLGHLDARGRQLDAHSSKLLPPPSSSSSSSSSVVPGPGRRSAPASGHQTTKAQLAEAEPPQEVQRPARLAPSRSGGAEDKARRVRDHAPYDKAPPQPRPSQGPANGTFPHGKKPCPAAPPRPPRSRAKPAAVQQKVLGYDPRSLPQKRKGGEEASLGSSLSRSSKCQRLASPSRPSLLTWKGENIGDVLTWGLDKRSDS